MNQPDGTWIAVGWQADNPDDWDWPLPPDSVAESVPADYPPPVPA